MLAIPLNVMDVTLFDRKYLLLNDNLAEKKLIDFTENALQYGGVFSVLFHFSFFWLNPDKRLKIFERLLQFLAEKEIKVGTCRDVFLWYRKTCN